jgi:tetratricopeptide (TPR) repeat protein
MKWSIGLHVIRACAVTFLFVASAAVAEPDDGDKRSPRHVTSQACKTCHEQQLRDWSDSHHDWAWRRPQPENVLGDFDDANIHHKGVTSRFSNRDGRYYIETDGPDGKPREFEVKYTVGVEPLQQYLLEIEPGRLQALDLAWDTTRRRWYHLYPDQDLQGGDGLHWTGPYKNWNARCAECHATGYAKNYDARARTYSSVQSEIGVGCEACHGPGEAHVAWAEAPGSYDTARWQDLTEKGFTIGFSSGKPETEIQQCAGCHARREPLFDSNPMPGTVFNDAYRLALLRPGLYHADGSIQDEVYVYGSFLQSKMHAQGVRCSDCHEPHGLGTRAEGNALCTQCHNPEGNPRFPTLKLGLFDSPAHNYHREGSEGAKCANCHMPSRTYMGVDPRRDHSFRVPRPDLSVRLDTPNACTLCHDGKSDVWAADKVRAWYPEGRSGRPHFSEVLAAGRAGDPDAPKGLIALARMSGRPAIVRATALDLLRRYGPAQADAVEDLLADPEPLVRRSAATLQELAPPRTRAARLIPLLSDPRRSVRIEAARHLVDVPARDIPRAARPVLRTAIAEYQASLFTALDFPETQMNLAGLAYRTRNPRAAEVALRTALNMDRQLGEAWLRLAELQSITGRSNEAEMTLRTGLANLGESGALHYSLGLILAERGNYDGAAKRLDRAAGLLPDDPRVHYNLALVLDRLERSDAAESSLLIAMRLAPNDAEILYALAFHYLNRGRLDEAEALAKRFVERHPERPEGGQLLEGITRRKEAKE